jgi:pimeloyl-ACP methyl ester carboxylesterase
MPYQNVNSIQMYYEESGSGEPLLLLHGGTGAVDGHRGWGKLRPVLSKQYRTLTLELRGHGRTNNPRKDLTYGQMADDARACLARMDCHRAVIAGIGDGAIVGLTMALAWPEMAQGLVLVGAHGGLDDQVTAALGGMTAEAIERGQPAWLTEMVQLHDTNKWPGYWHVLLAQVTANALGGPPFSLDDLSRVSVPVLLAAGEDDPVGNVSQTVALKAALPTSEMLILNHAGPTLAFTHRELLGPVILEWLGRSARP